ncbi:MAG: hypothetical protein Q4P78_06850 [Rothia sp. (in: high G+C Gram-positive bacteria)]|uniref:hypothetical protein n=1 Tax=Rothia sp. (in: high G+C Gram-positive bacteria) TaxID=1885016 RepID=UPI0026E09DBA|nr:hypothetical protein [Rothia sp. (in: high G+C Gram-positive bacteria)]MDO5750904.1 hypothetical protein [Rothia sp. (in: high G+C Gram-positive bacteria)]
MSKLAQNPLDQEAFLQAMSQPRFEPYLEASNRDFEQAYKLYRWADNVSEAFHTALEYTEVALRNHIDTVLKDSNERYGYTADWTLEKNSFPLLYAVLGQKSLKDSRARARSSYHHSDPVHDDILSQISFGFWHYLIGSKWEQPHHQALWSTCLHHGFPYLSTDPQSNEQRVKTGKQVSRLLELRNRISHRENLLKVNIEHRRNDILSLLNKLDTHYPKTLGPFARLRELEKADPRISPI